MSIREKTNISRLYQQKYLAASNMRMTSLLMKNLLKKPLQKPIIAQFPSELCNNPERQNKSIEENSNEKILFKPILLKKNKIPSSNSVPMRMKKVQYEQKGLEDESMLNKISERSNPHDIPNKQKKTLSSKNSQKFNSKVKTQRQNKSMSNVVRGYKNIRNRESWLQNFKELFMKNKKKPEKKRTLNSRLGDFRKQIYNWRDFNSYRIDDKNSLALKTEENMQSLGKKIGKSYIHRKQKSSLASRAATSELRDRLNHSSLKKQKYDEPDLKPWNYEVEEF